LSITLAWGKNFMPLTEFFLEYVPLYNKFRAVTMTLVMAGLSIPLLAFVALDNMLRDENKKALIKHLKYSLYIVGGILFIFAVFAGSLFSFSSPQDAVQGLPDWFLGALQSDRLSIFRTDAIRSLAFILATFGLLWAYLTGKLKINYVLIALPLLILVDMWPVNKRYLNNDDFIRRNKVDNPYQASKADLAILKDNDPYYRVYNMGEAFDASARTSFFHKNIGGYHGAKMRRYQEIIEYSLTPERMRIAESLNRQGLNFEQALAEATAFNMLNTKYFILNANEEPVRNPFACGNAWFVKEYTLAGNADEELAALKGLDPANKAVVDKKFEPLLKDFTPSIASGSRISLTSYSPNRLVYEYSAAAEEMAVFSEIYYDKGWQAYLDGQKAPHFRANFILRAMIVPPGEHSIEFRFEPVSYYAGQNVSLAASLVLILLLLGAIAQSYLKKKNA
jgi:hypothetical protein